MSKFQDASGSILDDLQATYEYLTEGETQMAVEIFKGISTVAGEMFKAAEALQQRFEAEKTKVRISSHRQGCVHAWVLMYNTSNAPCCEDALGRGKD